MHYSNGDQYIGDWDNGIHLFIYMSIYIKYTHMYVNICIYEYIGQNAGHGIISYRTGDTYTGTFLKGVIYGEGKYLYKDGSYYNGEYKNIRSHPLTDTVYPVYDGKKHGLGQRLWSNGTQYQGQWERDLQHGPGGYLLLGCSVVSVSCIICMLTFLLMPLASLPFCVGLAFVTPSM
jgi:hypothetical protein